MAQTQFTAQPVIIPTLVDSVESLHSFAHDLSNLVEHTSASTLYLDLEGINLSRNGTISLLTLLVHEPLEQEQIFLIDVHILGSSVFTTTFTTGSTTAPLKARTANLQEILECSAIKKAFFDVRNDADALYSQYGIRLQGVIDLQLMENAGRRGNKRFLHGLAKCIREDSGLSMAEKEVWGSAKERGLRVFAPEKGGRPDIFNLRPLSEDIKAYCVQDVTCLPTLYEVYSRRVNPEWMNRVREETKQRLVESTRDDYRPHGSHKALAPAWKTTDTTSESDDSEEWDYADDMGAQDCPGWEDDMIQNGEF